MGWGTYHVNASPYRSGMSLNLAHTCCMSSFSYLSCPCTVLYQLNRNALFFFKCIKSFSIVICFIREDLYSKTLADSITTPPLLIVFYKHYSPIDPMWHVRHLGKHCLMKHPSCCALIFITVIFSILPLIGATGAGNRYSPQFVKAAKLLHWNGHYKPWGGASSFSGIWDKWYIPDPTGKFHPIRRHD